MRHLPTQRRCERGEKSCRECNPRQRKRQEKEERETQEDPENLHCKRGSSVADPEVREERGVHPRVTQSRKKERCRCRQRRGTSREVRRQAEKIPGREAEAGAEVEKRVCRNCRDPRTQWQECKRRQAAGAEPGSEKIRGEKEASRKECRQQCSENEIRKRVENESEGTRERRGG